MSENNNRKKTDLNIDASIMIMSMFEPIDYVSAPPFGLTPFCPEAYDFAHMYGQFHWGQVRGRCIFRQL